MFKNIRSILLRPSTLLVVYIIGAVFASVQQVSLGTHIYQIPPHNGPIHDLLDEHMQQLYVGTRLTDYNNYVIFKYSFFHLLKGENMYVFYPGQYWDLFKYSPTFAFFMSALAYLPDVVGLSIWNLINALVLFAAIRMLPFKDKMQSLIFWFIAIELLTSLQNAQSNGLLAGLIIAAYGFLENRKPLWATLCLVATVYIKVYGAIGFCIFLFYPDKIKFILYSLFWTIVLFLLPLLVTPFSTLIWQYKNWAQMIAADQGASYGLSVMGWLYSWFGINQKSVVTALGMLLFLLPFVRIPLYKNNTYRLLILSSMLIWVIIFNHKAESPTYIIAVTGAAIWYFSEPPVLWRKIMLWSVFFLTCLASSDLYPPSLRTHIMVPYVIKAVPCIILWGIITAHLLTMKSKDGSYNQALING